MTPTIVLDFDGTIALGTGPLEAFARAIADGSGDAGFADRAIAAVALFENGDGDGRDGYDVVSTLARAQGVDPDVLEAAYQASRGVLGTADAIVAPPQGLADFLDRVGAHARLVLATNAPGAGIRALLDEWGVTAAFDALHFTVGKPVGLVPIISAALEHGPVLSAGDIYDFDLAPAAALGAATALVGATSQRSTASVTMRGRTLADLYADIESWAVSAASPTNPS